MYIAQKKRDPKKRISLSLSLGGDYLLSHFRSTIGVVRLNFSVRNGKRWDPHAIITWMSFWLEPIIARQINSAFCIIHCASPAGHSPVVP